MVILGIDPSMANTGFVIMEYTDGVLHPPHIMRLVVTEKNPKRKLVSHDDMYRMQKIREVLNDLLGKVDIVVAEIPGSNTQSARSCWTLACCVGLLSAVEKPLIKVTPKEVKQVVSSAKSVDKQQVIDWAHTLYPHADWLKTKRKGVMCLTQANEHLADAVAVVHASTDKPEFEVLNEMFV